MRSNRLPAKLHVQGTGTKITVLGYISQEIVDARKVQLKLIPVRSGDTECSMFDVKRYITKHISVGNDFINVDRLKKQCPHLENVPLKQYSYANVEMILSQHMFHEIRALEYFESDRNGTPTAVQVPLGWFRSGKLPSTLRLLSPCFKAVPRFRANSIWPINFEVGTTWNCLLLTNKLTPVLPPMLDLKR